MVKTRSLGYLLASVGLLAGLVLAAEGTGPEPTAMTSARRLVVPDEFATVQAAILAAKAGDTVFLKAGTYHEAIDLKSGIKLLGEGMDKVTLQFDGSKSVITVKDCCDVTICGLTARHVTTWPGKGKSGVLVVIGGAVVIEHCRITDAADAGIEIARWATATINSCTIDNNRTDGIEVGNSAVTIHACDVARNQARGIVLSGKETVATVRYCRLTENKLAGLQFWFGANGTAQENDCQGNRVGIEVRDTTEGTVLLKNHCHGNQRDGIQIYSGAQARAEQNLCEKNAGRGITVCGEGTVAALLQNSCLKNGEYGILVYIGGAGALIGNECAENHGHGIYLSQTAKEIKVEGNSCRDNQGDGIGIYDAAGGVVAKNRCQFNMRHGIYICKTASRVTASKNGCMENLGDGMAFAGETQSAADNNNCQKNKGSGIVFCGGARGLAEANVCNANHSPGISVEDANTVVTLRKNFSCGNNDSGILFLNVADSTAEGNVCLENLWSGIAVRGAGSKPTLRANQCDNNGAWGIISWAGADPNIAADNQTVDNWKGGIKCRPLSPENAATAKQI